MAVKADYFDTENRSAVQSRYYPEFTDVRSRAEYEPSFDAIISEAYSVACEDHPKVNQDAWMLSTKGLTAGVFDGVSMSYRPERAAESSARFLKDFLEVMPTVATPDESEQILLDAFQLTHKALGGGGRRMPEDLTTATVAKVMFDPTTQESYVSVASIGDSRAYLFRNGKLEPLTFDSYGTFNLDWYKPLQAKLDEVKSYDDIADDAELYKAYKRRNIIHGSLGDNESTHASTATKFCHVPIQAGDLVLLTSDGIHDNLTRSEMERYVGQYVTTADPETLTQTLVSAAQKISRDEDYIRAKPDDMTAVSFYFV